MSLPPAGYPKIRGQACGADWSKPTVVTGNLPNLAFGSQFDHTVVPVTNNYPLIINIGDNRQRQIEYAAMIQHRIDAIRGLLTADPIGDPLRPTVKERKSLEWLLDHAEAELEAADDLWNEWANRSGGRWPLDLGDSPEAFAGGVCPDDMSGQWYDPPGRTGYVLCPTISDTLQRKKDRDAIGQRFSDAIAHVYCAEYGYWRLRLYKEAFEAYQKLPSAGIGDLAVGPGMLKPDLLGPSGLVSTQKPVDPCKELGLGCPPGDEPQGCPTGFCPPEPEDLPDASDLPDADAGPVVEPPRPGTVAAAVSKVKPWHWIAGGVATLGATGVVVGLLGARR